MLRISILFWFLSLSLARGEQWVGLGRAKSKVKGSGLARAKGARLVFVLLVTELIRPSAPIEVAPLGAEPVGTFERKTQSPMTWCSLDT